MAKLNILTLNSSKNYTNMVSLGLASATIDDVNKSITFTLASDGSQHTIHFDQPSDGVSVTGISDKGNGIFTLLFSDGSESDPIQTVKGEKGLKGDPGEAGTNGKSAYELAKDNGFTGTETEYLESLKGLKGDAGFSPTITENADNTDKIYKLDITTADSTFTTPNLKGADGQGGGGTADVPIEKIKVNGELQTPVNKVVDITVPSIDGLAKTEDIPTKVSELTNDSGYLTEHQDISGKVDKVEGKSLISDTEIARLASVDNYDDTQVKTQIQAVANGLMDSVGYSADYKTIDIIAKNGVKKSVNVAPIISHASITELSDVDTTNKATGKALVYNATTSKHEYADVSGTDEKVKMDASTDAKYLGELLDNITIANENGELKVKKLDGQEVTITEINYLKGLTMNVMDLVNMFSNGGVKIINTPVATYAELLTLDKSSFIEGVSYLVYVLADENHDNAKTTYLVDKVSETPTYFGFADSQRDFTTNPIDLATEITGKLGISNMDSDAIKALFTVDDTYKTETATNNAFSTHGAKALYDELLLAIGNKANSSDLTAHKNDTDIHVSTEDRTNWDSAKTHADSAHAPSNAQANVIETVKVNGTALTPSNKAVNVTVPTTVAQLTDSSSYAKKTDIPTTLPANGGNAATVNNHTVETNVPADAVFTDTIYDDTEVKESIEKVNSNLDILEFGEVAGGKNLANVDNISNVFKFKVSGNRTYIVSANGANTYRVLGFKNGEHTKNILLDIDLINDCIIEPSSLDIDEIYIDFTNKVIGFLDDKLFLRYYEDKDAQYEPYVPSVKMLADEVDNVNESLAYNASKNMLLVNVGTISGVTITSKDKSTALLNGTNTENVGVFATADVIPSGEYHLKVSNRLGALYVWDSTHSKTIIEIDNTECNFTLTEPSKLLVGFSVGSGTSFTNFEVSGQLEKGTVATDFVPYNGKSNLELTNDVVSLKKNLSQLEFGEVTGVRNLFEDEIKWMENIPITRGTKSVSDGKITLTATSADCYTDHDVSSWKNNGIKTIPCKPNTKYTFSWEYEGDSVGDIYIFENGSTNNMSYTINKAHKLTITTSADAEYLIVRVGVRDSGTSITYWNFQLEEGDTATSYEPYIPSVKMLTEENAQQNTEAMDLKMLGWTVPSECSVQNYVDGDGIFHQRVGRVDLGSLDFVYVNTDGQYCFSSTEVIDNCKGADDWLTTIAKGYSSIYKITVWSYNRSDDNYDKTIAISPGSGVSIRNSSYTDVTTFKNAMKGVYLYYELAAEITKTIDGNEAVEELSSNLVELKVSDTSGGKNLQNVNSIVVKKAEVYITDYLLPIGTYTISFVSDTGGGIDFYSKELSDGIIGGIACQLEENQRVSKTFTVNSPTRLCSYSNITATLTEIQIEEGTTATPYEPYIPSVKMLAEEVGKQNESLSVIGKCKNLLNPTLQTTTLNGVTCTNNGDGTYTLNGTATSTVDLIVGEAETINGKQYICNGVPVTLSDSSFSTTCIVIRTTDWKTVGKNGVVFTAESSKTKIAIHVESGVTVSNVVFKPMVTTDLSATYDDFVPYTGDGDTLTHDVAEIKNDLGGLTFSASGTTLTITDGTNTWTLGANS